MFNYLKKNLLVFLFIYMQSFVAMEDDKAIIPIFAKASIGTANKHIFVPTENTPQANANLLNIVNNKKKFQEKDWEIIYECLKNDADPNLRCGTFQTPLISLVIKHNKDDLFHYLLQRGANINVPDTTEWTPLHVFMVNRPINFRLGDLLKNRANTNTATISGSTPLSLAVEKNHFDLIKSLIQYNADVNLKGAERITPLGLAIKYKNIEIIEQLCKAEASPTNIDNYSQTAFHLAANEPEKIIKTLITHVSFKNNSNDTTNTIKTVLLVFNRLNNFLYQNLRFLILSKLLSLSFFHKGLYKTLVNKGYDHLSLKLINEHVQLLNQILQIKNNKNKTALELAPKAHLYARKTETELLLDGSKLEKDLEILNTKYHDLSSVPKENLALQILKNHYTFEPK